MSFANAHITENYQEYLKYCKTHYRDRHSMAEELLHEFYLYLTTVPEHRLLKYNEGGKLKCICKLMIQKMYLRRGRKSSPLNEFCNPWEYDQLESPDETYDPAQNNQLDLLLESISKKLSSNRDWFNTSVMLMNNGLTLKVDKNSGERMLEKTKDGPQSLSAIAKEARLNRNQLGKACRQAEFEIRRYVDERGNK